MPFSRTTDRSLTDAAAEQQRLSCLAQRLRSAAEVLLPAVPTPDPDAARDAAQLLPLLARHVRTAGAADLWLVLTAVVGAYPTPQDQAWARRAIDFAADRTDVELLLLEHARDVTGSRALQPMEMDVVRDAVVVEADFSARNDKQTGIQRVTRRVSSLWSQVHPIVLVAWTDEHAGHRRLTEREAHRVLRHGEPWTGAAAEPTATARLCVPWHCTLVLAEVPPSAGAVPLSALAESSGNAVVAIGYDAIPVTSIDMRPLADATTFVRYLSMLKHARRIAAISVSSAAEFQGFASALAAQGIPGPDVVEVSLATEVIGRPSTATDGRPVVLCLGSHEPHKNHLAVLHVAEALWRDGLDFELHFVGGPGWDVRAYDATVERLLREGRPLVDHGVLPDEEMWSLTASATVTVFPSLHEGFGLPVAESLSCGTPVITTDYGSTQEIASAAGGCLLVDPRDDVALESALRRVLTEPDLLERLRAEARQYTPKSWASYAAELWDALVDEGAER
ncbi:glycosyltransferase family 4 protein [Cellulomonas sp. SG140]|uniref:glycosyltransferase family 4 protein n=1 Tax=Cellulomonas sp. SG140 TaxID=2976536 RepID=UPI0021E87456|nr:glycosyltransferase family 1 protein [Cellulomonas sp. SG140]